jgi:hypothetical protein
MRGSRSLDRSWRKFGIALTCPTNLCRHSRVISLCFVLRCVLTSLGRVANPHKSHTKSWYSGRITNG